MPRKESEVVPEGNGQIPQNAGKMVTWEEIRRVVKETWSEALKKIKEDLQYESACSKARAGRSADTSRHGGRRARRHEDSRAHGGRRQSNSSETRG